MLTEEQLARGDSLRPVRPDNIPFANAALRFTIHLIVQDGERAFVRRPAPRTATVICERCSKPFESNVYGGRPCRFCARCTKS